MVISVPPAAVAELVAYANSRVGSATDLAGCTTPHCTCAGAAQDLAHRDDDGADEDDDEAEHDRADEDDADDEDGYLTVRQRREIGRAKVRHG